MSVRVPIARKLAVPARFDPARGIASIQGIRVHDIGQGDALCVLGQDGEPFFHIDYGGLLGNPHDTEETVNRNLPVRSTDLMMLTHWDEDHWCSARRGSDARGAQWYVPRQTTSPAAVKFSATLDRIACVPEPRDPCKPYKPTVFCFTAGNGDEIWCEKIARWPGPHATNEDCNRTGIAYSVVKKRTYDMEPQVILMPGDAPLDAVAHYQDHLANGYRLFALVAYHHGSANHFTSRTAADLAQWHAAAMPHHYLVFSYSDRNRYGHPRRENYQILSGAELIDTALARSLGQGLPDLRF